MFSSYGNARLLLTSLKACDWSGHIFGASASPRSFNKKTGYVNLFHRSWRSAWYQACDIRVAIARGIRGRRNLGVIRLNQLVALARKSRWWIFVPDCRELCASVPPYAASTLTGSSCLKSTPDRFRWTPDSQCGLTGWRTAVEYNRLSSGNSNIVYVRPLLRALVKREKNTLFFRR